jgi:hypothetical protein
MLTQKERENALVRKLKKHSYFMDGDCKLTREEAALVLKIIDKKQKKSERQHERYMSNKDYYRQKGRERYAAKKEEINEKRRQARYLKDVEETFK